MEWDPRQQINEVAKRSMASRLGVRRELRKLPELLQHGEQVLTMASGIYAKVAGLLVATDRRVMFLGVGMARSTIEDFPYERISSVQHEVYVLSGNITIFASGNRAEIVNVLPRQRAREVADEVRRRLAGGQSAGPHPGGPAPPRDRQGDDVLDKLRRLGELRDAGVLTEQEFEHKKAQLLLEL